MFVLAHCRLKYSSCKNVLVTLFLTNKSNCNLIFVMASCQNIGIIYFKSTPTFCLLSIFNQDLREIAFQETHFTVMAAILPFPFSLGSQNPYSYFKSFIV